MGKNHNSKYIEKIGLQNSLKKSSLVSMLSHNIIVESFYSIKKHYMKVHEVQFVDYGLLHVFWYFFKGPFYYDNSKKFIQCDYNTYVIIMWSPLLI
jgi:hypothetical protein